MMMKMIQSLYVQDEFYICFENIADPLFTNRVKAMLSIYFGIKIYELIDIDEKDNVMSRDSEVLVEHSILKEFKGETIGA